MGYKQNNPLPMMKSAMKMHKAEKKAGMHRDSAMYMNSPMEAGHESPAMNYDTDKGSHSHPHSPMNKESRELKDMPIVDIEKGDAKGDGRINARKKQPKSEREYGSPANMKKGSKDEKSGEQPMSKDEKEKFDKKGSPANKYDRVVLGGNKGDKSKTKPGKKDYEGSPANMGHKDSPAELSWDDIKKAGRTAVQLGKDVAYQIGDMMFPDEGGGDWERYRSIGLDNPGEAARSSRNIKHNEQRNYDISRDKAARGETFFSAADLFDDSGKGDILGLKDSAKRTDKGSKLNEEKRNLFK